MKKIDIDTKLLGLFANPLSFTMSPLMHNTAFKQMNLNYLYIPFEVKKSDFKDTIKALKYFNFVGGNISSPYKTKIIEYLDEIDEIAKNIGAVNTITITDGKLKGYNTDGIGFVESLKYEKNVEVNKTTFLIIGCGGAARAIIMTLVSQNANKVFIANRTYKKAVDLAEEANKICNCIVPLELNKSEVAKYIQEIDVIINATKVGLYPGIDDIPIEIKNVNKKTIACDIIYNPIDTKFLQLMKLQGCDVMNGVGMLVNQGVKAFEIWTGKIPPRKQLYEHITSILKGQ